MTTPDLTSNSDVGMSLMAGEEAWAVVEVLREHLGDKLSVSDNGAYLRLETAAGAIEVDTDEVAEVLGRPFSVNDFQIIFSSYFGRPSVGDTIVGVYSSMSAGVTDDDPLMDA